MQFPRGNPIDVDELEGDLEFQIIDWYIPESDKSTRQHSVKYTEPNYDDDANDDAQKAHLKYDMYMFGSTNEGHSVTVKVTGFYPYFYVKLPQKYWDYSEDSLETLRVQTKHELLRGTYGGWKGSKPIDVFPKGTEGELKDVRIVMRKDFWGFSNGRSFPFLEVSVTSLARFDAARRFFTDRKKGFQLYETNIEPFIRFIHDNKIAPCGWVRIPKANCKPLLTKDGEAISRTQIAVKCRSKYVESLNINKIAPILIASFDIECSSSHGDFPLAKKDYRKLAMDLVEVAKRGNVDVDQLCGWIASAYEAPVAANGVIINRLFAKGKITAESKTLKKALGRMPWDDIIQLMKSAGGDLGVATYNSDEEEDGIDCDEPSAAAKSSATQRNADLTKLVKLLSDGLSTIQLKGDPLIQIGVTVHKYGSDEIVYKYIATLKECAPIDGVEVEWFKKEEDVLIGFKKFMTRLDPDILTGYNIFGFDMAYMWDRAAELGILCEPYNYDLSFGRLIGRKAALLEQRLSSSALGDNFLNYIDMDGVVQIDMLKVMQRDHKLDSYKLDSVAEHFLGDRKNDLKPYEIFQKQKGTAEDRAEIARYCVQDCALVNRLLHKLKVLENNVGMGNVCSVPLSYLFMRGQGVKIFSLVSKECREAGFLIPVIRAAGSSGESGEEDGYEGAIVLDPQVGMYLDTPVTVLDYSSLYPSSMIARNLSHDSFVMDARFDNLPGVEYETIEYDVYEGTGDKKRVVGRKACRFAQFKNGKGVIPTILQKLIAQRKNTRKKIEYQRLTLSDGRTAIGLVSELPDGRLEITNLDKADVGAGFGGHKAVIDKSLVTHTEEHFTSFEQAVLDALQLAYKITANSLYGQVGARTSPIYCKDIAASTTATGREMIMTAKNFVEDTYGAKVIYGDSVMPYTPLTVRINGEVQVMSIEKLGGVSNWDSFPEFKSLDSNRKNKEQKVPGPSTHIEVWTHGKWSMVKRIIRHKTRKAIYRISTMGGIVDVTEDHSLLAPNYDLLRPIDIRENHTELLHSIPNGELQQTDVSTMRFNTPSGTVNVMNNQVAAQEFYMLLTQMGYNVTVSNSKSYMYTLDYTRDPINISAKVTSITQLLENYEGYVYDLETEEGIFHAGVGSIVVKNTDSIFCVFPNKGKKGKEALPIAIESGQIASREIKGKLPPPQCLEYEKTFLPFIIFSKKRYVGNLYEDNDKKFKQKSMGIVLKRRDNAYIVKKVYGGIIDILLNKQDLQASVQFLKQQLQDLVDGKTPLEDLVITKTLRAEYKDPTKIAHKVLADRMGERDPGNKPQSNDRIPYIYIQTNGPVKLQGDRIETPDFIRENGIRPDHHFYITNQLMKPICQLYALCVEQLPGYNLPAGYWEEKDAELLRTPAYGDNAKKRADRIDAIKMKIVEELLFHPYFPESALPKRKGLNATGGKAPSPKAGKKAAKKNSTAPAACKHELNVTIVEKMIAPDVANDDVPSSSSTTKTKKATKPNSPKPTKVWHATWNGVAHGTSQVPSKGTNKTKAWAELMEKALMSAHDTCPSIVTEGIRIIGDKFHIQRWKKSYESYDEENMTPVDPTDVGAMMNIVNERPYARLSAMLLEHKVPVDFVGHVVENENE